MRTDLCHWETVSFREVDQHGPLKAAAMGGGGEDALSDLFKVLASHSGRPGTPSSLLSAKALGHLFPKGLLPLTLRPQGGSASAPKVAPQPWQTCPLVHLCNNHSCHLCQEGSHRP